MRKRSLGEVTDIERPDWVLLSDVLGAKTKLTPPADKEMAVSLLKGALDQAFAKDPDQLIQKSCRPKTSKGKLHALDYLCQEIGRDEGLHYVASRLHTSTHGTPLTSKRTSRYAGFEEWNPEKENVGQFIKGRVGHIIQGYYEQKKAERKDVSLDQLGEEMIEINSDGEVVRHSRSGSVRSTRLNGVLTASEAITPALEKGEYAEGVVGLDDLDTSAPEELEMAGLRTQIALLLNAIAEEEPGSVSRRRLSQSLEIFHQEVRTRLRSEISAKYAIRPDWTQPLDEGMAHSPNRPEVAFFSMVQPSTSTVRSGDIPNQIRTKAIDLLGHLKPKFNPQDQDILFDDLAEEWDPSKETLFHRFPELISAAIEVAEEAEYAHRCAEDFPSLFAKELHADAVQMTLFSEPRERIDPRDPLGRHMSIARENINMSDVWTAQAEPESLCYAERRDDYLFFCSRLGIEPNFKLRNEALHVEVKNVAHQWIQKSARFGASACLKALDAYDAGKDGFFTGVLLETLRSPSITRSKPKKRRTEDRASDLLLQIDQLSERNAPEGPEFL